MGSDERGRTIHGWLSHADHELLVKTVQQFGTNINRFTSFAVKLAVNDSELAALVGAAAQVPPEERLGIAEIRILVRSLREENEALKKQLVEMRERNWRKG